jgi:hypothetical protein
MTSIGTSDLRRSIGCCLPLTARSNASKRSIVALLIADPGRHWRQLRAPLHRRRERWPRHRVRSVRREGRPAIDFVRTDDESRWPRARRRGIGLGVGLGRGRHRCAGHEKHEHNDTDKGHGTFALLRRLVKRPLKEKGAARVLCVAPLQTRTPRSRRDRALGC